MNINVCIEINSNGPRCVSFAGVSVQEEGGDLVVFDDENDCAETARFVSNRWLFWLEWRGVDGKRVDDVSGFGQNLAKPLAAD